MKKCRVPRVLQKILTSLILMGRFGVGRAYRSWHCDLSDFGVNSDGLNDSWDSWLSEEDERRDYIQEFAP